VDWIDLAQEMNKWWAVVYNVLNPHKTPESSFNRLTTVRFQLGPYPMWLVSYEIQPRHIVLKQMKTK